MQGGRGTHPDCAGWRIDADSKRLLHMLCGCARKRGNTIKLGTCDWAGRGLELVGTFNNG
eukprot:15447291-Alexandrium_andersonii.AAC.1